ncbi:MAG: NADH:flavin oxidoreductase [Pseudomonadota bacterium]
MEVENRFVHSATYEAMALETGEVTDALIRRYHDLSKGGIGLIIPGYLYVHPLGKAMPRQAGIHTDHMIGGLRELVETVHQNGAKIAFQLAHGGLQTGKRITGQPPLAPSSSVRNPMTFEKPREMVEEEIREVIGSYGQAARRAAESGADAVQLHAAHGYLISEFLSPFFNRRDDAWGGTDEGRFNFLGEVFLETKQSIPSEMPILIKMNCNDFTPQQGVTPNLARKYAGWLRELGISSIELSCGTLHTFHTVRGTIPSREMAMAFPWWMRPLAKLMFRRLSPRCAFEEGYNFEAAKTVKPSMGEVPLILVGGMRRLAHMEKVVDDGYADFISLSRPLIREPFLIKRFKEERATEASCISCNRCFAAIANNLPLRCYREGFPSV